MPLRTWELPIDEVQTQSLESALTSGGDERIFTDPVTRRNRYGATSSPQQGEIFLSSSTATTISPSAYRAVAEAWAELNSRPLDNPINSEAWFDRIRDRLFDLYAIEEAKIVLAGSGTEAELIGLAIAKCILPGPLTNIILAPKETGSGVPQAASGAHFLASTPFGPKHGANRRLSGWEGEDIEVECVDIRDDEGGLLAPGEVDARALQLAREAMRRGRNVLLHLLDTSKTGRPGLSLDAAIEIMAEAPDRIVVFADCCQLRRPPERIRQLLRRGLIVAVTGSKFFAGPPFSGALLLPPTILARVARWSLPAGLAEHSSRLDWPSDLQGRIPMAWTNEVNFGLGLRWIAALSEMERFFAIDAKNRARILDLFENEIRTGAARVARLEEWRDTSSARDASPPSILSFVMSHPEGTPHSFEETAAIHARLRSPGDASGKPSPAEIFHLGQPVRIGPSAALRVCISAPMISDVADLMKDGADLETAFLPWRERLRALFDKWGGLIGSVTPMSSTPNA